MNFRSTTAVRLPSLAIVHATNLPPVPLPSTTTSYLSALLMRMISYLSWRPMERKHPRVRFFPRSIG